MADFAGLAPEVISGQLYAGAGAGPLTAAAAAWDQLAAQWGSAAGSYQTVIAELTDGPWRGPAAESMAAAAREYVAWLQSAAQGAEQTANRVRLAVAAYQRAFAAVVPPAAVAANRAALASLVSGNVFGQNSALIAANQAQYQQMSAQDISAMYDYAAASAAATDLPSFPAPPQATKPAGNPLAELASGPLVNNATVSGLNNLLTLASRPLSLAGSFGFVSEALQLFEYPIYLAAGKLAMLGPAAWANAGLGVGLASSASGGASGMAGLRDIAVSASVGRAATLGELSVPLSWGSEPQQVRLTATVLPMPDATGLTALPEIVGTATPAGRPGGPIASMVNTPRYDGQVAPAADNAEAPPAPAREAAAVANAKQSARSRQGTVATGRLTDSERRELDVLREEMAELARDCELMTRLMKEAGR